MSRDTILDTVVTPFPALVQMDQNRSSMDYDLCTSLEEVEGNIEKGPRDPIFMYTQPQNIHISVINRQGAKSIDDANYRQFYAPYASRLRRIDGCFAKFINFLKARNLYDSSIVDPDGRSWRFTGRRGPLGPRLHHLSRDRAHPAHHARSRRVSLEVRLQSQSSDVLHRHHADLYYLLGNRPIKSQEMYGRPLFTEKVEEQGAYKQDSYLVASSYAAVYGILAGDGRSLIHCRRGQLQRLCFRFDLEPSGLRRRLRLPCGRTIKS